MLNLYSYLNLTKFNMKKLSLLFLLCISIAVLSCSSDDSDSTPEISEEAVLGTWIGVDVNYTSTSTINLGGESFVTTTVGEGYDVDYTITFNENPQTFLSEGSYSAELTVTSFGQTQVQNVENYEFGINGEWSLVGNQLSITNDEGEDAIYTIEFLSNGLIQLTALVEDTIIQNGIETDIVANTITTYERQ
ncbi:hypothetical protein DFQ10_102363 [Winogradskyella eximia]|jgi:hypothetical protein|uniref:Lipocalin-like protein n=2 Tax=Winogradskyella eximia TaxID=262006 RepID=A0A3D9H7L6_9FLAO|nr:hypothetical protein DFQ10_102363 [Winogradskyella eximia]